MTETTTTSGISLEQLLSPDRGIQREFILEPFLQTYESVLLVAERGLGKTWFSLALAYALSTGTAFGDLRPSKPRSVFYIDGEMGEIPVADRMKKIIPRIGKIPTSNMLQFLTQEQTGGIMWNLSTIEGKTNIWPLIKPFEVIIIDNLMTVAMRENQYDNPIRIWERMQSWIVGLRRRGKTIILLHHTNKVGDQSGTKDKENIQDTIINLNYCKTEATHKGAKFVMEFDKTRNLSTAPDKTIWTLHQKNSWVEWQVKSAKQSLTDHIKYLLHKEWTEGDICREMEISKSFLNELLRCDASELPAPPPGLFDRAGNRIPDDELF